MRVHACPEVDSPTTPCCGQTPFELSRYDRMTNDPSKVTCGLRVYISGPMTGLSDNNYPAFAAAEKELERAGYVVQNPANNKPHVPREPMWRDYMRMSLVQLSKVDGIALLPGWKESRGAQLEYHIAHELGYIVKPYEEWLR